MEEAEAGREERAEGVRQSRGAEGRGEEGSWLRGWLCTHLKRGRKVGKWVAEGRWEN